MPRLDLRRARRIKTQGGEVLRLKGDGFSWARGATFAIAGYGQSQTLFFFTRNSASQPSPIANTRMWDPATDAYVAPDGYGIVEFLNSMARPGDAVFGGEDGVPINRLQKGHPDGHYDNLLDDINASGIDPAFLLWHQGEGDAAGTAPTPGDYPVDLDQLHTDLCSDLGKTKAEFPIILSSLATTESPSVATDEAWTTIQNELATINSLYPNIHFSHSNMPAGRTDLFHWLAEDYGKCGRILAHTARYLEGSEALPANWQLDPVAERVSPTQTRVRVVHSLGTDFTPTTGITGFRVSGDNAANWEIATGIREDATTILLTHADVGTADRRVDYQKGRNPDVSGAVLDNSYLQVPLQYSVVDLLAPGAAALPVPTHIITDEGSRTEAPTLFSSAVAGETEELLLVMSVFRRSGAGGLNGALQVTAQPSGATVPHNLHSQTEVSSGGSVSQYMVTAELPLGTTAIQASLEEDTRFVPARFSITTIPKGDLTSTAPIGAVGAVGNAASLTANLPTAEDGVVVAVGQNRDNSNTATDGVWSGDVAIASRAKDRGFHSWNVGDASPTAANASAAITLDFDTAHDMVLSALSFR